MSSIKHFLIVDDSRLTRMIIAKIVSEHYQQWQISHAHDAQSAVEMVKSQSFDFISLDHNMPDVTGLTILPDIQHHQPNAHIGVFTANIQRVMRQRVASHGVSFYPKPINEAMVLRFIGEAN
ncbi:response regulator [Psychrobium sp. 1_MG-2023]|uniref:response regulator n=1 Tax=Psychrobium sp. 1_MG-2023 TaxID=3062624 RepID=UPI00269A60A0|nr:response regulator [Psychrobium sp. 1_MG-2023]MDP2560157.1 response regulator [Psychrobium sp. 1_MG-2023]